MKRILSEVIPFSAWDTKNLDLKTEIYSAVVGAILVVPQAITFAFLAGLPPEYGIYSAIFVTFFAAMFGASPMTGGPNTAVAILIGVSVLPFAGRGSPLYIEYVLLLTFMVGVVQLFIWLLRSGRYFQYFSPVVITGITTGVGVLIMISALDGLTGMKSTSVVFIYQKLQILFYGWHELGNGYATTIGLVTLIIGWISRYFWPRFFIIIALVTGYLTSLLIHSVVPQVLSEVEFLGYLPFQLLPLSRPPVDYAHLGMALDLIDAAISIALIGLAQTMVIIKDIKIQKKLVLNSEKEVFAQAFCNLLAPFFSSFAGAGSFNRTNVALSMGATTPLSAMLSSVFVVLVMLLLGPVMATMPLSAMSAILFLVGAGMIKPGKLRSYNRSTQDVVMLWITFFSVVLLGLKVGIAIAILLSVVYFLLHANQLEITNTRPADFQVVTIHGNCFFASIDQLLPHFAQRDSDLILNLEFVAYFDDAAAEFIQQENAERTRLGHSMLVIAPRTIHKACFQRVDIAQKVKLFDSFAKARTALHVSKLKTYLDPGGDTAEL